MERKMKSSSPKKSIKRILAFVFIMVFTSLTFTSGTVKNKDSQSDEMFKDVAGKIKKSYDDKYFAKVIDLYNKHCRNYDKRKPGKEKREFKKVKKEIRAEIYKWVALSYYELDKPTLGELFLERFRKYRGKHFKKKFSHIAARMKKAYMQKNFSKVIELYKRNCCKEDVDDREKVCKERIEFKMIKKKIRNKIYHWVALSYFLLKNPVGKIYLGKLAKESKAELNKEFKNSALEMREAYDNGDLDLVIELYNKYCCKEEDREIQGRPGKETKEFKRVKKEIRADIYEILVLSLTALDMPETGEKYLQKILVLKRGEDTGSHWLAIRETAREKYDVPPRLLVGLNTGINLTQAQPGDRHSLMEDVSEKGDSPYHKTYFVDLNHSRGSQLGITVEYALTRQLRVCSQPAWTTLKFQYKDWIEWKKEESGFTITHKYTNRQRLSYMEIPLLLKYQVSGRKLKPYLQIGGFFRLLTSATKIIKRTTKEGDADPYDRFYKNLSVKDQFYSIDSGFWVGVGAVYDTGIADIRLMLELNYKHGFNNIVDGNERWNNRQVLFGYYDVFDDMKLKSLALSLKVLLPLSYKAFKK